MTEARIIRKEITKLLEVVIEDHEREENTERLLQAEHPTTCRHPAEGAQAPQEAA